MIDSERNSLLSARTSSQFTAQANTAMGRLKTEKRLIYTYQYVLKYIEESKEEQHQMQKILAPLLIYIITYLIKNKSELSTIRRFYESNYKIPRQHCPEGVDLALKHLEEAEKEKSSSETLKKLTRLAWTIEISNYTKDKFLLYLEMNGLSMAEHIINSRVKFETITRAKAHMAIDRVILAQPTPEVDQESKINISKLPRFDQLDINSRSGVFIDNDGQEVLLAGNTPIPRKISPEEVKRQSELKKYAKLEEEINHPSVGFFTLQNGEGLVTCMDIAHCGVKVATGYEDGTLKIFEIDPYINMNLQIDPAKINRAHVFKDQLMHLNASCATYAVSFSPDDTLLISGGEDGVIRLWSVHFKCKLASYTGHNFCLWDVKFANTRGVYFASASQDRTARVWRTDSSMAVRIMVGHLDDVECVQFSPNLQYLATSSADKTVRLWDIASALCRREFLASRASIRTMHFPGRMLDLLLCGSEEGDFIVLHLDSGKVRNRLKRPSQKAIWSITSQHLGNLVAVGCQDDCVELYDLQVLRSQEVQVQMDCMRSLVVTLEDENKEVNEEKECENEGVHRYYRRTALVRRVGTKRTQVLRMLFLERGVLVGAGKLKNY